MHLLVLYFLFSLWRRPWQLSGSSRTVEKRETLPQEKRRYASKFGKKAMISTIFLTST